MTEEYTPGYTQTASDFMAQRSAVSQATYDCSQSPSLIADVMALKLGEADANALRSWSVDPDAFFAQAWCEVLGTKPR